MTTTYAILAGVLVAVLALAAVWLKGRSDVKTEAKVATTAQADAVKVVDAGTKVADDAVDAGLADKVVQLDAARKSPTPEQAAADLINETRRRT